MTGLGPHLAEMRPPRRTLDGRNLWWLTGIGNVLAGHRRFVSRCRKFFILVRWRFDSPRLHHPPSDPGVELAAYVPLTIRQNGDYPPVPLSLSPASAAFTS